MPVPFRRLPALLLSTGLLCAAPIAHAVDAGIKTSPGKPAQLKNPAPGREATPGDLSRLEGCGLRLRRSHGPAARAPVGEARRPRGVREQCRRGAGRRGLARRVAAAPRHGRWRDRQPPAGRRTEVHRVVVRGRHRPRPLVAPAPRVRDVWQGLAPEPHRHPRRHRRGARPHRLRVPVEQLLGDRHRAHRAGQRRHRQQHRGDGAALRARTRGVPPPGRGAHQRPGVRHGRPPDPQGRRGPHGGRGGAARPRRRTAGDPVRLEQPAARARRGVAGAHGHRPVGAAALGPPLLHLHGFHDHAAVQGRGALDGDEEPGGGVVRPAGHLQPAVPDERPAGAGRRATASSRALVEPVAPTRCRSGPDLRQTGAIRVPPPCPNEAQEMLAAGAFCATSPTSCVDRR